MSTDVRMLYVDRNTMDVGVSNVRYSYRSPNTQPGLSKPVYYAVAVNSSDRLRVEEGPFAGKAGVGVGSRSTLLPPPWVLKEIPLSPREVGVANALLWGMLAVGVDEAGVNVKAAELVGENPGVPATIGGRLEGLP